mgnify:CR=1 FL=1
MLPGNTETVEVGESGPPKTKAEALDKWKESGKPAVVFLKKMAGVEEGKVEEYLREHWGPMVRGEE